jgi:hypothetical protein
MKETSADLTINQRLAPENLQAERSYSRSYRSSFSNQSRCTLTPGHENPVAASTDLTYFSQAETDAMKWHIRACSVDPSQNLLARLAEKTRFYGANGFQVAAAIERARRKVERHPSWHPKGPGWITAVVENEFAAATPTAKPSMTSLVEFSNSAPPINVAELASLKGIPAARTPNVDPRVAALMASLTRWRGK